MSRISEGHIKDIVSQVFSLPFLKTIVSGILFIFSWFIPETAFFAVTAVYLLITFDTLLGVLKGIRFQCFSSQEFFRVGIKSVVYFVLLGTAHLMDKVLPVKAAGDIMSSFLFFTELASVVENAIILGVPIPKKIVEIMKIFHEDKAESYPKEKFLRKKK